MAELLTIGEVSQRSGVAASSDQDRRDDLRRAVVGVLDELGAEHPLARESRRKLASALY